MDGGSKLDGILKQIQAQGGLSAGPQPAVMGSGPLTAGTRMAGGSTGPAVVLPANAPQTTDKDGMAGILDAYKAAGAMMPGDVAAAGQQYEKKVGEANAGAEATIGANQKKLDALMAQSIPIPAAPQLQSPPKAPDTRMQNPLNVFANQSTVLALLGSLFTRAPLITAMNAASAAIKGYAAGDKDAADRAHKSWQDALQEATARNQAELDQYNAVLQNTKLHFSERDAQLQALAASNNDATALAALKSGDASAFWNVMQARLGSGDKLAQILIQSKQYGAEMAQRQQQFNLDQQKADETHRHNTVMEGGNMAGGGPLDADTVNMLAEAYRGGDKSVLQGLGYGRQGMLARQQVLRVAAGVGPVNLAQSRANYQAVVASLKNTTNYVNRAEISENTFLKNAKLVQKYMTGGVGGSPSPVVNRWIQAGRRSIQGDPEVTAFDVAVKTAAREYGRIVTGAVSNAMLTDAARDESEDLLSTMMNSDQINSALSVMQQDIANTIEANQEQMASMQQQMQEIGQPNDGGDQDGQFKEGDTVIQDGHTFKLTNGKWVAQ